LSEEDETEYYLLEEEQGVYAQFWQNLGYYQEHGVEGYPPFSRASLDPKRANNRARGWNGLFFFSLKWKEEATAEIRKTILTTLTLAYGWKPGPGTTLADWLYEDPLEVELRLTGQRVKNLTRLLNRQYQKGYLVWKELSLT
jgi:hypothetical protein